MIGLPATGKSTFTDKHFGGSDWVVVSTDNNVMEYANAHGMTYNEAWEQAISKADARAFEQLHQALNENKNIIVDRTNLTVKSRSRLLNLIDKSGKRSDYQVAAYVFGLTLNPYEWTRRLMDRPTKTVPANTLINMASGFQMPSFEEGFDAVVEIM